MGHSISARKNRRRKRRLLLLLAVLAVSIYVTSSILGTTQKTQVEQPPAPEASRRQPVTDKPSAPDFEVRDVQGNPVRLSDFRGKVVLIFFTVPNCPSCAGMIPVINSVKQFYEPEVVTMGISIDPAIDNAALIRFAEKYKANWIWARDTASLAITYRLVSSATIFLIDREGGIAFRHNTATSSGTLSNEIQSLLR